MFEHIVNTQQISYFTNGIFFFCYKPTANEKDGYTEPLASLECFDNCKSYKTTILGLTAYITLHLSFSFL